jgi:hypothetical protein
MKRRKFLKSLPVLSLAPLAICQIPAGNQTGSRHLIALGTVACRLARNYSGKLAFDTITMIDGENPSEHQERFKFIKFISPESLFEQLGDIRITKGNYLPILPLPKEIKSHLESLSGELVFLSGLGGMTSKLLTQSIGTYYSNIFQSIEWVVMLPFEFQGVRRVAQAQLAIHVLAERKLEPTCLYLDEIRREYGNLSIRSAYQKADEWVVAELNGI